MEAFRESARLSRTWGEELIGGFSFGLIFFALSLPAVLLIAAGVASARVLALGFVAVAGDLCHRALRRAGRLQGIFPGGPCTTYAKKGETPPGFDRKS